MNASTATAIAAAVVAALGVVVALLAQRSASRSADGSLQSADAANRSAGAAESSAEAAKQQSDILQKRWESEVALAAPNVEIRVTHVARYRDRPGGWARGTPSEYDQGLIDVTINVQNLSMREDIIESVSVCIGGETYKSAPAIPVTLKGEQIPVVIQGNSVLNLEFDLNVHRDIPDTAHEEAIVTVDCKNAGKLDSVFYVLPRTGSE